MKNKSEKLKVFLGGIAWRGVVGLGHMFNTHSQQMASTFFKNCLWCDTSFMDGSYLKYVYENIELKKSIGIICEKLSTELILE